MGHTCKRSYKAALLLAAMASFGWASGAAAESEPAAASQAAASQPGGPLKRTREQVEALIEQMGKAKPEWFDAVEVDIPETMDLTMSNPPDEGWQPTKNVGTFLWAVIGSNPSRYREGVKFMHQVIVVNQKDPKKLAQAENMLAGAYYNLLEDYARAVYWWRKADKLAPGKFYNTLAYARAYYKLGCKEMALQVIGSLGRDNTGNAGIARLWAEMGDTAKAIMMAEAVAKDGRPDVGYLAAGDFCRQKADFKRALVYYQKVLATTQTNARNLQQNQERARRNVDGIKVLETLDLSKVKDGTYKGNAIGYKGQIDVEVAILGGRIESVKVTQTQDDRPLTALTQVPSRIVEKQGIKGVDVCAAATITSDAIINATGKALGSAMK